MLAIGIDFSVENGRLQNIKDYHNKALENTFSNRLIQIGMEL
jgi:hypothetical protein